MFTALWTILAVLVSMTGAGICNLLMYAILEEKTKPGFFERRVFFCALRFWDFILKTEDRQERNGYLKLFITFLFFLLVFCGMIGFVILQFDTGR